MKREELNHLGQPVGFVVSDWKPAQPPTREPLEGRYCRVERLNPERHAESLFNANALDREGRMWTYLSYGPFDRLDSYREWAEQHARSEDPLFYAIVDRDSGKAIGIASYLRIDRQNGVIEVGHLAFSPVLQRTRGATEAMYLMMKHAFDSGYRRYEWKCNSLNAPSRAAASGSDSRTKASSDRPLCGEGATATRRGSPSSIRNGLGSTQLFSVGSIRRISTRRGSRNSSCRI